MGANERMSTADGGAEGFRATVDGVDVALLGETVRYKDEGICDGCSLQRYGRREGQRSISARLD